MPRGKHIATLFNPNPRALSIVEVWWDINPRGRSVVDRWDPAEGFGGDVRLYAPGDERGIGETGGFFGGYGHIEGGPEVGGYLRFHSPGVNLNIPPWKGKGYGFMLYAGAALVAETLGGRGFRGIYSDPHREIPAACLWAAMECVPDAEHYSGLTKCKKRESCEPLAKRVFTGRFDDLDERVGPFDTLKAVTIRERGIVMEYRNVNFTQPPKPLVANAKLIYRTKAAAKETAMAIRQSYDLETARSFLSEQVRQFRGSRMVAGLGELPELDRRSVALVRAFKETP